MILFMSVLFAYQRIVIASFEGDFEIEKLFNILSASIFNLDSSNLLVFDDKLCIGLEEFELS